MLAERDARIAELSAAMLKGFDEVQVWKDVDGILTADPRVCAEAKPVPRVSFTEAAELAYFGAKVLHPVAMQPAIRVIQRVAAITSGQGISTTAASAWR
mgnify:CR=1 FL=1